METASDASRTVSVYSTPTRVLALVAWTICAALVINLIWVGTPGGIWQFLPWMLFIAWGVFVLLWRPCLTVSPDGLTVRNLLRDHTIPFGALRSLRVIHTVTLETTAGRIPSWGAPGAGKLGPRRAVLGSGPALPRTQTIIQRAWDLWERSNNASMHDAGSSSQPASTSQPASSPSASSPSGHPGTVTSGWNLPTAVVGVIVVLLVVATVLT